MQKPALSSLGQTLRNSVTSKSRFSPMSYLKYLATSFHRIIGNAEIAPEHKPHMLDLFVVDKISELDVTSEGRSDHTDCSEIASAVTQFISQYQSYASQTGLQLVVKLELAVLPRLSFFHYLKIMKLRFLSFLTRLQTALKLNSQQ